MMGFVLLSRVPAQACPRSGAVRVYALVDPRHRDVRYVGVTNKPLSERLARHLESPTNARTRAWFGELADAGKAPEITEIQRGGASWERAEMEWVAWFRARGDLLNVDAGGSLCLDGSGLDDIKREKAATFLATAKATAGNDAPPPCAQDQRTMSEKWKAQRAAKARGRKK